MIKGMTVGALRAAYQSGTLAPGEVMADIRRRAGDYADHNIWITLLDEQQQAPWLARLENMDPATHPLWGVPFAIKDNIDLAGVPTTAGCEAYAYVPEEHAEVVRRLIDAGAIPVGKTNLDQFATGLNGTRSPWGACANAFDDNYISGGSSSGSAVAVALGLSVFSLGTDTAGSGRVPAAFNNLVGLKPTRGLVSARGVVPACRSLDCVSVFAHDTGDAHAVLSVIEGEDPRDCFSRANAPHNGHWQYGCSNAPVTLGVIPSHQLRFFGDAAYQGAYHQLLDRLASSGVSLVEIDYRPFAEAAELLYQGPWVAERYLVIRDLLAQQPDAVLPVIRDIISKGETPAATDLFAAQYRLQALSVTCREQLERVDAMLTPTAGRLYTREQMLEDPIRLNNELGYYTNFMNLLDLCSVALPGGFTEQGLPFGITLVADCFSDRALLSLGAQLAPLLNGETLDTPMPQGRRADARHVEVLVCGAHLDGLPLNWQLRDRGAMLLRKTRTAPHYRFYALAGGPPYRPGLVYDEQQGAAVDVEIWQIPVIHFGSFVAAIPAPLGIGKVVLEDGSEVSGFICEPRALQGAQDITAIGNWRDYMAEKMAGQAAAERVP
ncbi:MAG: allophanate hydrolase [Alcanivoracaceae bacterium]|nr:allophanate hydrolase [Alcanivoracaceae bacterium]